ncbi:MAG: class I SAM-dependent methyltransferase [Actinobacteria bacterium]|nr:class I SAM-dependent methyltransferase [Actinomycetota bacterium]
MARAKREFHHPVFARLYTKLAKAMEPGQREHRGALLAGLEGFVVEVGAGSGMNFSHYPESVARVLAIEPEPYLRHGEKITVLDASAYAIPAETASADAVVFSLVLCSVGDQGRALVEAKRVLKPGGLLCVYEHVAASGPSRRRYQDRLDFPWSKIAGGCHCNRETEAALRGAGFDVSELKAFDFRGTPRLVPVEPHVLGQLTLR